MLEKLKEEVYKANMELKENGLVICTWGNVSGIDREKNLVVIKPSGVEYNEMKVSDMVVVDLDGNVVEGNLKPSSDTKTHLILYKNFDIGGVVHTHSTMATSFAQSGNSLPPLGTTHSDYFYGDVPCTRTLTKEEVNEDYEGNTGHVIVERFNDIDPKAVPAVLVNEHAPFTWGKNAKEAVYHSIVLEEVAKMAFYTLSLNKSSRINQHILDKHYFRKHGANSYYGQ
ncbi:MAG: L-ribulose-5-phosphate 4-epimerase [Lachnospirales bacterium]